MGIAERCAELRHHFALSGRAFSTWLGISYNLWFQYEAGRKEPSIKTLQALAARNVNVDWLVAGRGTMLLSEYTTIAAPTPSREFSLKLLSKALQSALITHGGGRLSLWTRIVTFLDSRPQGADLCTVQQLCGQGASLETLASELELLSDEGIVAGSAGVYRLVRASFGYNVTDIELRTLACIQELLDAYLPRLKEEPQKSKLITARVYPARGKGVVSARSLMNAIRHWKDAQPAVPDQPDSDWINLTIAMVVVEHEEPIP